MSRLKRSVRRSTGAPGATDGLSIRPSLTFGRPLCMRAPARRGRRYPQGAHAVAVSATLRLRCAARSGVAPLNSLRSLRSLRSNRRGESVLEARCARRPQSCAARRHRNRPLRVAPAALPPFGLLRRTPTGLLDATAHRPLATPHLGVGVGLASQSNLGWQRGGRHPVGAISGATSSAGLWSARASALPHLTRRVCLSGESAANAASSAARPQAEQHSGVGAKRRPPQHEPPPGAACRAALTVARMPNAQHAATRQKHSHPANESLDTPHLPRFVSEPLPC